MTDRRIYGVDFSGSQTAGNKIWLSSAISIDGTLFVEGSFPARELVGGASNREQCYSALVELISASPQAVFGFDFPFGVPDEITEHQKWETFVAEFGDTFDGPLDFHEICKQRGGELPDSGVEYQRDTDRAADAPFCPYNWRMKEQTYHGINDLLSRLVDSGQARVLPMQSADDSYPWVLEVCPSSTLEAESLPRTGYKGSDEGCETVRRHIIEELEATKIYLTTDARKAAIQDTEGDALDSIIAAVATARAIDEPLEKHSVGVEGHIYV